MINISYSKMKNAFIIAFALGTRVLVAPATSTQSTQTEEKVDPSVIASFTTAKESAKDFRQIAAIIKSIDPQSGDWSSPDLYTPGNEENHLNGKTIDLYFKDGGYIDQMKKWIAKYGATGSHAQKAIKSLSQKLGINPPESFEEKSQIEAFFEQVSNKIEDLQKELEDKARELESQQGQAGQTASLINELQRLKEQQRVLEAEKAALLKKLREQEAEMRESLAEQESESRNLKKQLEVAERNAMSEQQRTSLESARTIQALQSQLAQKAQENERLAAQIADLTRKLDEGAQDRAAIGQKLEKAESRSEDIQALEAEMAKIKAQNARLQAEAIARNTSFMEAATTTREIRAALARAESESQALRAQVEAAQQAMATIPALQKELAVQKQEAARAQRLIVIKYQQQDSDRMSQLAQAQGLIESLRADIASLKAQLKDSQQAAAETEALQKSLDEKNPQIEALNKQIETLNRKIESLNQWLKILRTSINGQTPQDEPSKESTTKDSELASRQRADSITHKSCAPNLAAKTAELVALQNQLSELQEELDRLKKESEFAAPAPMVTPSTATIIAPPPPRELSPTASAQQSTSRKSTQLTAAMKQSINQWISTFSATFIKGATTKDIDLFKRSIRIADQTDKRYIPTPEEIIKKITSQQTQSTYQALITELEQSFLGATWKEWFAGLVNLARQSTPSL